MVEFPSDIQKNKQMKIVAGMIKKTGEIEASSRAVAGE